MGKNNRYGHPKEEVLETLNNSKIYITDLDGSIEIKLNKNGYNIRTFFWNKIMKNINAICRFNSNKTLLVL